MRRFIQDVNIRRRILLSLFEPGISPQEFTPKNRVHLTNWAGPNRRERDKVCTGFHRFTEIGQIFHNISQLSCKASSKVNGSGQDPVWMTRKPRKGDLREFKAQKFPGSAQEACAFCARLGNQSVFTPDPRLVWRTQIHYSHCIHNWRITEFELHPSVLCVFGAGMMLCCLSA